MEFPRYILLFPYKDKGITAYRKLSRNEQNEHEEEEMSQL